MQLRVYISVDLEGVAGVASNAQAGGSDYEWARPLTLAETNAAIRAAFDAGATEVVVNDAHGSHTNLRADQLDRRATLITGQPKPYGSRLGRQGLRRGGATVFPGVEGLAVKEGIGFTAARPLHPAVATARIAAGVKAALGRRQEIRPIQIAAPITLDVELNIASNAGAVMFVPGMERLDGVTVRYRAPDALVAYRVSRLIRMLARD